MERYLPIFQVPKGQRIDRKKLYILLPLIDDYDEFRKLAARFLKQSEYSDSDLLITPPFLTVIAPEYEEFHSGILKASSIAFLKEPGSDSFKLYIKGKESGMNIKRVKNLSELYPDFIAVYFKKKGKIYSVS